MSYRVDTDGVDHINVAATGRTMLGIMLHVGAYSPIVHPEFGYFVSVAGFWGWLGSGRVHDVFRHLYGESAFRALLTYQRAPLGDGVDLIKNALWLKVEQNQTLRHLIRLNRLPLVCYNDVLDDLPIHPDDPWRYDAPAVLGWLQELNQAMNP
jgi:hypothetical protein